MLRRLPSVMFAVASAVAFGLPAAAQQAAPDGGVPADSVEAPSPDTPRAGAASRPRNAPARPRRKATQSENQPALITADQIVHDRDLNTVTARGHVEVDQGERILLADTLSYNLKQDVIIATGNVSLTEASGEVTFADYIELTGDMKNAATKGIRVLMIDDSRIAANSGHRVAGDRSIFDKGVYTACKPCADGTTPPLWQLKADRVTHDEIEHLIEYNDAWLEIDGVPVAYTPYLSHADPTVKRESGLLPPSVINRNIVGSGVRTPYFQVIDPYQDITLSPLITSSDYEQLAVMHRWRDMYGGTKTVFSVTNMPESTVETKATIGWHIDATARFDLDDTWRAGYAIQRASDRYYLSAFGYNTAALGYNTSEPYLTTRPYLEGFSERNYAALEAYSFQSMTTPTSTTPQTPVVFPLATYSFVGIPHTDGSYWTFDTHAASINRQGDGVNSRRINTLTAWNLPYTASDGEIYKISTSVRADAYDSDHLTTDSTKLVNVARGIPMASVDWRYPFTRLGEHSSQTLSPIIVATASPYGGNSSKIPNEDSLDFELDDTNIFKANPGTGYDRVLTGPRVAYGGEYTIVNRGMGTTDLLLAQSYQVHPEAVYPEGSGLDHRISDIVGRAGIAPSSNLSMVYGFRMDKDNLTLRRSEFSTSVGPRPLNLTTSYVFYDRLNPTSLYDAREQLSTTLTAQASHYWSTQIYTTQNLGAGAAPLQTGIRLNYEDECLLVSANVGSNHTTAKTFSSGHYFTLTISFKTLAQIPVDLF